MIPAMKLEYVPVKSHPVPGRYSGDIGVDLVSTKAVWLTPLSGAFIPAGFRVRLPDGMAALILPRSSSNRSGLHVCTGVIDNGYTGEIGAEVRNLNPRETAKIEAGDRVAQLVLIPAFRPELTEVDSIPDTDRSDNGFGSTG